METHAQSHQNDFRRITNKLKYVLTFPISFDKHESTGNQRVVCSMETDPGICLDFILNLTKIKLEKIRFQARGEATYAFH